MDAHLRIGSRLTAAEPEAMPGRHHWDYFLALEEDVHNLRRYVHFTSDNLETYSIEFARLLMAATQEIDVLFKQICAKHGDQSEKEPGYQQFFSKADYAKIRTVKIAVSASELELTPFRNWAPGSAPEWWTANNKVKHSRHTEFPKASLANVLNALAALLIANIYFAHEEGTLAKDVIQTKMLRPIGLLQSTVMNVASYTFKMPQ